MNSYRSVLKTFIINIYSLAISLVKSTFNTNSLVNETAEIIQQILQQLIPIPLILNETKKYQKHPEFQQNNHLSFYYFTFHLCSIKTLPWHVGKFLVYFACTVSVLHLWCFIHNPNLANVLEVVTEVAVLVSEQLPLTLWRHIPVKLLSLQMNSEEFPIKFSFSVLFFV